MKNAVPFLACWFVVAAHAEAQAPPAQAPIAVARLAFVEGLVEVQSAGKPWSTASEGSPLHIGDTLRTGPAGNARIDFPWMSVSLASASTLSIPSSLVLATVLDDGRVEQSAQAGDIIKLLTAEARIRGEGRVVVRRQRGTTLVSAQSGSFRVEGNGKTVTLAAGEGTRVEPGSAPTPPEALLPAPIALEPGDDPRYVLPGETVSVRFNSSAGSHHLQVLGVDSSQVLIERDIAGSPATLAIPWPGTFRWRVAARDAHGLEGLPSREGLIAVVAK